MGWRDRLHPRDVNALGEVIRRVYWSAIGQPKNTPPSAQSAEGWAEVVKAVLDIAQVTVDDVPAPVELPSPEDAGSLDDNMALADLNIDPRDVVTMELMIHGQRYGWRYHLNTRHMHNDMVPLAREHAIRRGVEAIVNEINGKDVTP